MRRKKTPEIRAQLIQCAALYRTAHERTEGLVPRPPEEGEDWGIEEALQAERIACGLLDVLPPKSRYMLEKALDSLDGGMTTLGYMSYICDRLAQS